MLKHLPRPKGAFSQTSIYRLLVYLTVAFLFALQANASHLMGGDFTYTFVSKSGNTMTYKISMKLYRDCNSSTAFPNSATVGIYYANNNSSYGTTTLNRASGYSTEKSITPTCIPTSGLCIAEMLYENTISLPANNTTGYYISAHSCCRNGGISNINNPGNTGMGWLLYIPPPNSTLFNKSVNFSSKPLPFVCVGDTISFNHLAYDTDGDSLAYSLVTPYASSGMPGGIAATTPNLPVITYAGGSYTTSNPIGTDSYIGINSETGEIKMYLGSQKTAIVSVEVKEYRKNANGTYTYVGSVRRDLQIIAKTCTNYAPPKFIVPSNMSSNSYYNRTMNALDSLCFDVKGVDSLGDSLYISSAGAIFDGSDGQCSPYATFQADTADSVITKTFCWQPGCCRAGKTYIFTVNLLDNNCGSRQVTFSVKVNALSTGTAPQLRCVDVQSNTSIKLTWNPPASTKNLQRYILYRRSTGSFVKIDSINIGTNTYTDNTVSNAFSTQYQYMIKSKNVCDTLSSGDTATSIKVSVSKPFNYKAAVTYSSPKAAFKPTYYKIYRNDGAGGWTYLDSTRRDTFFYFAIRCSDSVQFKVIGYDSAAGCESGSMHSTTISLEDLLPPLIMGFRRATVNYDNYLRLDFKRNDSFDTKMYYIYKKNVGSSTYILWDSVYDNKSPTYTVYDSSVNVNANPELPCYKIQAKDSCNNYGSFYEEHCPVNLRGKPGNLRAYLNWRNYIGFSYDSFFVYRNDVNGVYVRYATKQAGDTSYVDSGLLCNQTYTYILRYVNYAQDSLLYSESDTVEITPYDTITPAAPKMHLVTVASDTKVDMWFFPSASTDVNNYDIYRIKNGGSPTKVATLNYPTVTSGLIQYTDTGLTCLKDRYCYYVVARDSCSDLSSPPSNVHCDVELKGTPGNNRCFLSWKKYKGRGIEYYNIIKLKSTGWTNINSLYGSDSTYVDSINVSCDANIYRIEAVDSTGNILSYSDTAWVFPYDTIAPIPVFIKKVTVLNHKKIYLHWTASSLDINRYILYRSVNNNSPQPYDTLSTSDTSYTDSTVDCLNNFYAYTIEARDSCKDASSGLAAVQRSMNLSKKMDFCQKTLDLYWNKYIGWEKGTSSYQVLRSVNGGSFVTAATVTATDSHFVDTVSYGRTYTYRILATETNGFNQTSLSDSESFYFRPVKGPEVYSVSKISTSNSSGSVQISFNVIYYDSLVKFARLYYSATGAAGSYSVLKDSIPIGQTTFTHGGINTRTADHYYYMVNIDTCGDATDSNSLHKTMNLALVQKKIRNRLYWTPYKGFGVKNYVIERIDSSASFLPIDTVKGTDTAYVDYPSPCNGYVTYRIAALDSSGLYISYSDTVTLPPIDTIATDSGAIYNVSVLDDQTILVEFYAKDSSDIYGYTVKHAINTGPFVQSKFYFFVGPGYQYTHIDSVNTLQDEHSYILYTVDSCLNATPSKVFTAIQLRGFAGHLKNTIYFNKYKGYPIGYYEIYEEIAGSWIYLDSLGINDTSYEHAPLLCNIPHKYKILGYEDGNNNRVTQSDSIWLFPYDSVAPDTVHIKYVTVNDYTSVDIEWYPSDPDVGSYDIWMKSANGSWGIVATAGKYDSIATISGLNTTDSIYEFSLVASDSCANNKSVFGPTHTIALLNGFAGNKQVNMGWTSYGGFKNSIYYVEKYINGAWTVIANPGSGVYTFADTGLGCNTDNYYRIKISDGSQFVSYTDSVLIIPFDTVKPGPIKLKSVTVNSGYNKVTINWNKSVDADVKNYEVWRGDSTGSYTKIADVGDVNTYTETVTGNLPAYCYYIIAYDSCDTKNRSLPSDTDCTSQPWYTFQGCIPEITLHWNVDKNFEKGIAKHRITRIDSLGNISTIDVSNNVFSYRDTLVTEGVWYIYTVTTIETGYNDSATSYFVVAVPLVNPKPVAANIKYTTVMASSNALGVVKLAWSRNPSSDTLAVGYRLYHSLTSNSSGFSLLFETAQLNDTVYIHDSINTMSARHYYYLEIFDYCDRTGFASAVHSPVNLQVTDGNLESDITWTRYEGWPVGGYDVYRSWIQNGNTYNWLMLQVDSGTFSFKDTSVSCDINYQYIISATEITGKYTSLSNIDTARIIDTIPPAAIDIVSASVTSTSDATGSIDITFNAASEKNRSGYKIYRSIDGGAYSFLADILNTLPGVVIYTDNNINTLQSVHSYYITASDSCNNESTPSDSHTVVNLTATAVNDAVKIDWTNYTGFTSAEYLIERMDDQQLAWIPVVKLSYGINQFYDSTVDCNKLYYYRISTLDLNQFAVVSFSDTQSVFTFENTAPDAVELTRVSVSHTSDWDGNIIVEWNESTSKDAAQYVIERRLKYDLNWQQVAVTGRTNNYIDAGLNTSDTVYIYRIKVIDSCGNISTYSTVEHGNINLTTFSGEQNISMNWGSYIGWPSNHFILMRNGEFLARLDSGTYNYTDTPLTCTQLMNYQIIAASLNDTSLVSSSDSSLNRAVDHIAPAPSYLKYATVSVPNKEVKLEWNKAGGFDLAYYEIYRKYNGTQGWSKIHTTKTADTTYYDQLDHIDGSLCYRLVSSDSCSNFSIPSNDACLVYLKGYTGDFRHDLTWTPYTEWKAKVKRYELWRTEDNKPKELLSTLLTDSFNWIDTLLTYNVRNFCYQVAAYEDTGSYNAVSWSNEVCMLQQPIYWIPNAFTPNEDDLNETFGPTGIFIDHYEVTIYDRWGEEIFVSRPDMLRWNARFANGKPVPVGLYMYQFKFYSYDGRVYNVPGTVYILR